MNKQQAEQLAANALNRLSAALGPDQSEAFAAYLEKVASLSPHSIHNVMAIATLGPEVGKHGPLGIWLLLASLVSRAWDIMEIVRRVMAGAARPVRPTGSRRNKIGEVRGDPGAFAERLERFIADQDMVILKVNTHGNAAARSYGDIIEVWTGLSRAEAFASLVHIIALKKLKTRSERRTDARDIRQIESKAVTYAVCSAVGLDALLAAMDYIRFYRGGSEIITASFEDVQRIAAEIILAISE